MQNMRLILVLLTASICFGQSQALKQYVGLTDQQAGAIAKLNSDYQIYASDRQRRVNVLNQELSALYATPAPDPNELGARYVEVEGIRRDLTARLSALRNQVAALLTAPQAAAVQNLKAGAEAEPLISDAQCGLFLDSGTISQLFNSSAYNLVTPAPSGSFCGSNTYPVSVREYFGLSDAQVSALFAASLAYNDYYARKQYRIADLNVEIRDETAKPSPSAAALGVRYAELIAISRDIQNQSNQVHQSAAALLTAAQTVQLKTLQTDVVLELVIFEAENLNLVVLANGAGFGATQISATTPLPFPGNIIPASRIVTLQQYLGLTDQQAAAVRKVNSDFQQYLSGEQARINTVNAELNTISASAFPDTNQLGVRYLELEVIRRDIAAHLAALQAQNAAQLSKPQVSAIQTLNTAAVLQPLISDAQCGFLIDANATTGSILGALVFGTIPTAAQRSGDFSFLLGYPAVFPYIPPAPTASFCGSDVYPISVREYLNLTDGEVTTIFNQSAAYNDYYARKQNRVNDVEVEIRDETAQASPNALALGLRYSEIAAIGQQMQSMQAQLRQAARASLNPQQAAQVKTLQDDVNLQPLIAQAQSCNLLVLAPGSGSGNLVRPNAITIYDPLTSNPFPGGITFGCPL